MGGGGARVGKGGWVAVRLSGGRGRGGESRERGVGCGQAEWGEGEGGRE